LSFFAPGICTRNIRRTMSDLICRWIKKYLIHASISFEKDANFIMFNIWKYGNFIRIFLSLLRMILEKRYLDYS